MSKIINHIDSFFEELLKDDSVRYSLDPSFQKKLSLHALRASSKQVLFHRYSYSFIGKLDTILSPIREHAENIEALKRKDGTGMFRKHNDIPVLSNAITDKANKLMESSENSNSEVSYRHLFDSISAFIKDTINLTDREYRSIT